MAERDSDILEKMFCNGERRGVGIYVSQNKKFEWVQKILRE